MRIEVLGIGCVKCKKLYENVSAAAKGLNMDIDIIKTEDMDDILDYGVMMLPALVVDGIVVSSGKVLSEGEIKKIILK